LAQQGSPPGRHSRGPYPGDAPYGDEIPYAGDAPYADEIPYGGEVPPHDQGSAAEHASRSDRGSQPDPGLRPDRSRRPDRQRPGRAGWQQLDPFGPGPDTDTDLPPWAGPVGYPAKPTGTLRRPATSRRHAEQDSGPAGDAIGDSGQAQVPAEAATRSGRRRGRAAATRLRKSRRRVYRWGGIAIAACVVAAGITLIATHHTPKPALYVTSLQHGEFTSVPSACGSVGTPLLNQFLPGPGRTSTSELASSTDSQCSFTVDSKPNFLVLEVEAQSYQPFAAATGDGSATANAQDNFALAQQGLAHPARKSPLPPAHISNVIALGQQAIMAFQNEHVTGIATDVVTVVVRERNVVITASMSGQESGHGFGPVPLPTLEAAATAAAKAILAKVMTQPTA
jgi:hypothetical protein